MPQKQTHVERVNEDGALLKFQCGGSDFTQSEVESVFELRINKPFSGEKSAATQ